MTDETKSASIEAAERTEPIDALGQNIRALREAAGISQGALADELNLCQSELSRLELGWTRTYRSRGITHFARLLVGLSDYFNVSVDELLGRGGRS